MVRVKPFRVPASPSSASSESLAAAPGPLRASGESRSESYESESEASESEASESEDAVPGPRRSRVESSFDVAHAGNSNIQVTSTSIQT